jgi:dolichyl-phosphate beta-glucosyltransferase
MDHYKSGKQQDAEVFVSVVVPAYNEEERLGGMLEEAVDYLQQQSWCTHESSTTGITRNDREAQRTSKGRKRQNGTVEKLPPSAAAKGWEILIVSDGSTDGTVETALSFARSHQLLHPKPIPGPRTPRPDHSTQIPPGAIRVISLEENRGKGGAVTHGMRHARGAYVLFVDADGASEFSDLGRLVGECRRVEDSQGRGVAVGSRAHLVGSEAVVKVRN